MGLGSGLTEFNSPKLHPYPEKQISLSKLITNETTQEEKKWWVGIGLGARESDIFVFVNSYYGLHNTVIKKYLKFILKNHPIFRISFQFIIFNPKFVKHVSNFEICFFILKNRNLFLKNHCVWLWKYFLVFTFWK